MDIRTQPNYNRKTGEEVFGISSVLTEDVDIVNIQSGIRIIKRLEMLMPHL